MSNSGHDDNWWVEPLLIICGVVAAVAAVIWIGYWILFGLVWIVPYALFTVIPLAIFTAVVGFGFDLFVLG